MSEMVKNAENFMPDATKDVCITTLIVDGKNPRGIPTAKFIEDVEEFLGDSAIEATLGSLNDLYGKYKYMESSFEKSKNVYKGKLPDLEQTIDLVKIMIEKKSNDEGMMTNYSLCDTIYAKANVDVACGKVCLWIGASTMVEYTHDEALELLTGQLSQTHDKIAELNEDLAHLRENSITVEVNMARLFNHSVKLKKAKEAGGASSSSTA